MAMELKITTCLTSALLPASSSSSSSSYINSLCVAKKPLATSFLNGDVGALKVSMISLASSGRTQRGRALVVHMKPFDRFARVVKPYANAVISSTGRITHRFLPPIYSVSEELEDVIISSQSEDVTVITITNKAKELKVTVKVSGAKTEALFDDVFSKMVAAAQPIPGFRRVKGGKTPDIPRDILLEVLGPSKVYKQVIKKVINTTIAEYVKKEGIKVGVDLKVEQSFEDLEAMFEPGEKFTYDAIIHLAESN